MVHQAEMVVGVGIPGTVDLQRPRGPAAIGVAQVGGDAAVLGLELRDRIERRAFAGEPRDRRVQSAAGDQQQREAGAGLLEVDANVAFFVHAHGRSSLPGLLGKHARRGSHGRRRGTCRQYGASDRIHHRRLPGHFFAVTRHRTRRPEVPNARVNDLCWRPSSTGSRGDEGPNACARLPCGSAPNNR